MEITEKFTEEKPNDSQLDELEEKLGNILPRFYREFLKDTNGGRPKPEKFSFTTKDGTHENDNLHYFYALYSGKIGNLGRKIDVFKDRIPEGTLPIACDSFGNQILLRMGNQPDGPVYFWDHELELLGDETRRTDRGGSLLEGRTDSDEIRGT